MHHPVAERGGGDEAGLAFVEGEQPISAGLVSAVVQFPLQGQQFAFQIEFEGDRAGAAGFAAPGLSPRLPQILEGDELRPEVAQAFHGSAVRARSQPPICRPRSSISRAPCS